MSTNTVLTSSKRTVSSIFYSTWSWPLTLWTQNAKRSSLSPRTSLVSVWWKSVTYFCVNNISGYTREHMHRYIAQKHCAPDPIMLGGGTKTLCTRPHYVRRRHKNNWIQAYELSASFWQDEFYQQYARHTITCYTVDDIQAQILTTYSQQCTGCSNKNPWQNFCISQTVW